MNPHQTQRTGPLDPPPTGLALAVLSAAALVVACGLALVDAARNGYALWPPSPNLLAAQRARGLQAAVVAGLTAVAVLLPWALARSRRCPQVVLAAAWGALLAAVPWAVVGYRYNRYSIASLWRERTELFGLPVPRALLDGGALAHNAITTLLALALAVVLALALRALTSRLRGGRAGRAAIGAASVCGVLLLGPSVAPSTWGRPRAHGPDLILITLDATRADRLGCYGYARPITPRLDSFAREAVRYDRAYCQEPWTLTSHMSMLTGLYPDAHGLDFGRSLAPRVWTAAERLRDAGYRTAGSVFDCFLLDPRFGYASGFDRYEVDRRPAARRCADAVAWLTSDPRPGFLFLHLYDPHSDTGVLPYEAPPAFTQALGADPAPGFAAWAGDGGASEMLRRVNEGSAALPDSLRTAISNLYDAGVAATDAAVGEFLDALRQAGRLDRAVVIVLADHGEALGEQGHFMHERMMEATLRIPLLVRWPAGEDGGQVREDLVETVDVAPTLWRAAGVPPEPVCQGHDLRDPPATPRAAAFSRSGPDYAVTTHDRWRLLYRWEERGPRFTALRQLGDDPSDGPDRLAAEPQRVDPWVDWIWARHRANQLLAARFRGGQVQMSGQDEELLRSLGYVQ